MTGRSVWENASEMAIFFLQEPAPFYLQTSEAVYEDYFDNAQSSFLINYRPKFLGQAYEEKNSDGIFYFKT